MPSTIIEGRRSLRKNVSNFIGDSGCALDTEGSYLLFIKCVKNSIAQSICNEFANVFSSPVKTSSYHDSFYRAD
jgi:hypothetical protein